MTPPSLSEMIGRIHGLPVMPAVALEVLDSMAGADTDIKDLARRITQAAAGEDPGAPDAWMQALYMRQSDRDTMQQERVSLDKVADYIAERIGEKRVSVPQMPVEMGGEAWPESVKIAEAGGLY